MSGDEREALLALAFLYAACGQYRRGLVLLMLIDRYCPDDVETLRALGHAFTEIGRGDRALDALDRLQAIDHESDQHGIALLRSRALYQLGRLAEAQKCFAGYVIDRRRRARYLELVTS